MRIMFRCRNCAIQFSIIGVSVYVTDTHPLM